MHTYLLLPLCFAPRELMLGCTFFPLSWSLAGVVQRESESGAIALYTSRRLMSATAARTHIWTETSTVPPNQNEEMEQTSAKSDCL